eukprot:TRINITY_DN1787_c0_g1_i1.p1 TRINITY_DN1787_c0_g1~~TRINITY_DN1787_c0_g1_i1.p1  ORF type:complete len:153 (-),score=27.71 TRINITY_DN1787_c0_g1_i1:26-484(-)
MKKSGGAESGNLKCPFCGKDTKRDFDIGSDSTAICDTCASQAGPGRTGLVNSKKKRKNEQKLGVNAVPLNATPQSQSLSFHTSEKANGVQCKLQQKICTKTKLCDMCFKPSAVISSGSTTIFYESQRFRGWILCPVCAKKKEKSTELTWPLV